jgi:hypothetical protein
MPASYWLLLAFLLLIYANTPFIFPAAEVIRPAKLVAALVIVSLIGETVFGGSKLRFAWPEGGLLIAFLTAAGLSCLTALWPGYAADGVADLAKMALTYFLLVNCVRSERALRGVMWILVIGGLFPAVGTLKNYLQGNLYEDRASWVGIFANPNEVAYSLVILVPFLVYLGTPRGWGVLFTGRTVGAGRGDCPLCVAEKKRLGSGAGTPSAGGRVGGSEPVLVARRGLFTTE